jgi:hypothetical protein
MASPFERRLEELTQPVTGDGKITPVGERFFLRNVEGKQILHFYLDETLNPDLAVRLDNLFEHLDLNTLLNHMPTKVLASIKTDEGRTQLLQALTDLSEKKENQNKEPPVCKSPTFQRMMAPAGLSKRAKAGDATAKEVSETDLEEDLEDSKPAPKVQVERSAKKQKSDSDGIADDNEDETVSDDDEDLDHEDDDGEDENVEFAPPPPAPEPNGRRHDGTPLLDWDFAILSTPDDWDPKTAPEGYRSYLSPATLAKMRTELANLPWKLPNFRPQGEKEDATLVVNHINKLFLDSRHNLRYLTAGRAFAEYHAVHYDRYKGFSNSTIRKFSRMLLKYNLKSSTRELPVFKYSCYLSYAM